MPKSKKSKKSKSHESLSNVAKMPLSGFKPAAVMWPPCLPVRLRYTDYRVLTGVLNEAQYVYRLNSLFDPDQTGVGGQPEGFDQLKTLYGRYRVVAAKVTVEAVGNGANTNGYIAMAPIDNPSLSTDAESVADLRFGVGSQFSQTNPAKISRLFHIGELLGYSDESMLGNANMDAAVTASPTFQQYVIIAVETGNSATGQQMVSTEIEYYVRMEVPIAVEDSATKRRKELRRARIAAASAEAVAASTPSTLNTTACGDGVGGKGDSRMAGLSTSALPLQRESTCQCGMRCAVPGL